VTRVQRLLPMDTGRIVLVVVLVLGGLSDTPIFEYEDEFVVIRHPLLLLASQMYRASN